MEAYCQLFPLISQDNSPKVDNNKNAGAKGVAFFASSESKSYSFLVYNNKYIVIGNHSMHIVKTNGYRK